jgi:hypothetical protein
MPMDMSKLPRLSNTAQSTPPPAGDAPAPPAPDPPIPSRPEPPYSEQPMTQGLLMGAEVWLTGVLGLIFMLLGKNFGIYLISKLTGGVYHTGVNWTAGPLTGTEVSYPDLQGFVMWTDASLFLFGLAMVFEAIVLFASSGARGLRRPLIRLAFAITILAIGFNLIACVKLISGGATPFISLLATAFAVYIAMYEWTLLKATAPARPV